MRLDFFQQVEEKFHTVEFYFHTMENFWNNCANPFHKGFLSVNGCKVRLKS